MMKNRLKYYEDGFNPNSILKRLIRFDTIIFASDVYMLLKSIVYSIYIDCHGLNTYEGNQNAFYCDHHVLFVHFYC